MECPHVNGSVKLNYLSINTTNWVCTECMTKSSPCVCLNCGVTHCGRYVAGHALTHFKLNPSHCICMESDLGVYCYLCDSHVSNDTTQGHILQIRNTIMTIHKTQSDDGVWLDLKTPSNNVVQTTHHPHNLRPRRSKRSLSSESNDSDLINNDVKRSPRKKGKLQRRGRRRKSKKTLRAKSKNLNSRNNIINSDLTNNNACGECNENKPKRTQDRRIRLVGLRNLGNTCFMNAVLQSLSNIQQFCLYFKKLPSLEGIPKSRLSLIEELANPNNKDSTVTPQLPPSTKSKLFQSRLIECETILTEELRKILISLSDQPAKSVISPEALFVVIWKVIPKYKGFLQQDAHEFLRNMLDRLHIELLHLLPDLNNCVENSFAPFKRQTSFVTTIFGGTLQSEVRCLNCGTESKKQDPFLDLSLDIPSKWSSTRRCKVSSEPQQPCHILDCLTSFISVEELADSDKYYCSICKSKQRSTKRFWIHRLPNVLCIHLKRFRWSNFVRMKVDTSVQFPVTSLDMSQFVTSDHQSMTHLYDLAAVIVHHGMGPTWGHYTAFAIKDGQWFHFNDSMVRPTETHTVAGCKPYILFYIRKEFHLPELENHVT